MAKKYTADSVEATSITGSLFGTASFATKTSGLDPLYQNVEIHGNLNVYGTSSFTYVTSSQIDVQESFISVNVFEPAERFGGLTVYDSGSSSATASLAWDSLHNHWVYQNTSGSTYSGGMLLAGPRNTGSLGDEPNLTKWMVARSDGGDHLDNTQIFSSGSVTQITGSLLVSNIPVGTTENQVVVRDGSGNLKYRTDLSLQGATGTQGTQGVAGYVGSDGAQGATGTQGTQGIQGVGGSIGGEGTQGTQGIQGTTGASIQGAQGYTGAQGTTGATGAQGIQGITGTQGATGTQGSTGAQGAVGSQGATGIQGSTGSQGTTGAQGTTGTQGIQGIQGVQGTNAGITSYTNASDNRVITSVSSTTINAEANLLFDGTYLDLNGNATIGSSALRLSMGGQSLGFNRRVHDGAIYSNTGHAYQFQHTPSTTNTSDYLAIQVYGPSGAGVTSTALTINGAGNVAASVDMRAPIFYDSNDTAFYTDPASTSNLNKLRITSAGNSSGGNILMGPAGEGTNKWSYLTGTHYNATSQAKGISVIGLYASSVENTISIGGNIYEANPATQIEFYTHTAITHSTGGTRRMYIDSGGNVVAAVNIQAPIFYDSADNGYYGDFNSTTRQYQAISFGDSSRYSAINTTINGTGAGDKLILYGGVSNYDARLLVGADYDMLFKSQGNSSGRGSYKFYSGNTCALALTIDGTQGLRAGTSYNTSPASTYFSHTLSGVGTNRVVNFDGNGTTPSVWWTNGSRAYGAIDAQDPGMTFWANNGSSWQQQMAVNYGNITINTDIRTPILYDSNDTAYYVNPASTSNLNAATFNGNVSYFGQLGIENQSTFARLAFNKLTFWDWQGSEDVVTIDGGYLQAANSLRAPIFYDSENTGYYTNPAGKSRMSSIDYGDAGYYFSGGDWGWRHNTPYGWIQFGPANSGHAHIYTSLSNFYLNAPIQVNGVSIMNTDDIRTRVFYDYDNTGYYVDAASNSNFNTISVQGGTNNFNGITYFRTNNGGYLGSTDSAKLQAYSDSNNAAFMSFHKGGHYAVNFGLDADNVMRLGGWSASSNRWQLDMSGNMTVAGDVTAYSDSRVKENVVTVDKALEKVNALRGVYYNRTDSEDKKTKLGVIAQEILEVVPEVVGQDNDGMYNVSYGNLAGLFIEAIKEQQTQIENQQSQIDELKSLVKQLLG